MKHTNDLYMIREIMLNNLMSKLNNANTETAGGACGEFLSCGELFYIKFCLVENYFTSHFVMWRNSPHNRLSCGKSSPHEKICNVEK